MWPSDLSWCWSGGQTPAGGAVVSQIGQKWRLNPLGSRSAGFLAHVSVCVLLLWRRWHRVQGCSWATPTENFRIFCLQVKKNLKNMNLDLKKLLKASLILWIHGSDSELRSKQVYRKRNLLHSCRFWWRHQVSEFFKKEIGFTPKLRQKMCCYCGELNNYML